MLASYGGHLGRHMSTAFARASGAGVTAARMAMDAGFRPGSVPARFASKRLRPSQRLTGAPIRDAVIPSGGMRPPQSAAVECGGPAAIPPISSVAGGPSAGLRPSQAGLPSDGDGGAKVRIQRCGIGSSCDCPPRNKLAGIERDVQRATAGGGAPLPAASRERMESAYSFDFAAVRVHTSAAAHDAASALGARALTVGTDILFRAGEYMPGTMGSDRLVAQGRSARPGPAAAPLDANSWAPRSLAVAGAGQWSAAVRWRRSQSVALLQLRAVRLSARLLKPCVLSFRFSGAILPSQDIARCRPLSQLAAPMVARYRLCRLGPASVGSPFGSPAPTPRRLRLHADELAGITSGSTHADACG